MKTILCGALCFAILGLAAAERFVSKDTSDETLKFYLDQSELVVKGNMESDWMSFSSEFGVIEYHGQYKIQQVLKGDEALKDQSIDVVIKRFESDEKDKHPCIATDAESILFLKGAGEGNRSWHSVDFWFAVQHPSPWMARSLKRIANP